MPLKEDSYYDDIYQRLVNILEQQELPWIVQDVNRQIVVGKVTIPTPEEKKAARGKRLNTYSTSYSSKERLELLISAIKYIIVNMALIEKEVLSFYFDPDQNQPRPQAIKFSSEVEHQDVSFTSTQQVVLRHTQVQKLGKLLDKLQEVLNNGH